VFSIYETYFIVCFNKLGLTYDGGKVTVSRANCNSLTKWQHGLGLSFLEDPVMCH